jgi:type VI secretion system protein ImpC
MFIINRLAHYIKVIQRENIGSWKEKADLTRELNAWIGQYVSEQDNVSEAVRGKRPLRMAEIVVEDVEGDPGWYRVDMRVRPHFKYMGAYFSLSLVGKLDKK